MKKDDYFQTHFAGCYYREKNNPTNQKKLKEIIYLGYKNGRILDIGCAYGFFLGEADKYGFETYGIDISKYALGQADKNTKAKLVRLNLSTDKIPFKDVDVCVMLNTLEHIPNYWQLLEEVKRILKRKGLLCLFVPTEKRWLTDPTHINFFTVNTLRFVLEKAGFKIIKIGEEGGIFQIPLGVFRLLVKGNTNFNFVPEGTGSFISCFAQKYFF
ncbi:MAG: putative methyltransferase [Candidatus Curtissbacteria bacterium GW2011_GWC2_38_9]|uniref:Uncharacterized protein n=3 Tax=Candidatus Curtissiibacteriota TaxID=1752717 RepID=A0A1F5HPU3_9BACT|nr:MAG: putative methyltransferase [Candidatus Curtissbacteria bacterium GW2011_GWC2_38_9]KKS04438.1 MAG: putative methyltransferase [Candidatus Curtissbacteria bacterium GW2011_GWA2_41_24]OGD89599.1 MAG: hypothetical protein A2Z54_01805 [Candidatus Curtissbacteria bacterium RIFCSPHIGHO2_02_39_8]OGE06100.1 MAG: hypothetical protein A2W70_05135 [Candidatus Curtissbacteria bacterium RIFCSPLOWO2_02_41_11]